MFQLQKQKAIEPEELMPRPLKDYVSDTAAAAQTFDIEIPTDHFIHGILMSIEEPTEGLADDILDIQVVLNGNNFVKVMTGDMCKAVSIMNKNEMTTGYYMIYFTDPKIPSAKPLPAWLFSSIYVKVTDNAPAAAEKHTITTTLLETAGREITGDWHLLVEKYLRYKKYGTDTGWQDYYHERAYNVFGYLYAMDDNGTLSNTIFDKLLLIATSKEGEKRLFPADSIPHLREIDKIEYQTALPDGFVSVEFPAGLPSHKFTSLLSQLNITTAGTDARLRVLERYCL